MRFSFTEDQRLLQSTVRDFLVGEVTPARIRELWETKSARSPALWRSLAEIGVPGLLVPESAGGMGMDEIDLVLLLEEAGRAALAEPVIATAAVGVPLLRELGAPLADEWLPKIAAGEAIVAVGHETSPLVSDAHVANLIVLPYGAGADVEIHALGPDLVALTHQPANDPSHRLYTVEWKPSDATRVAQGARARQILDVAFDRGALACAAELLGVADKLVEIAVGYASQRKQFGKPIGSFQAVKHMLASAKVKIEYARPLVYRAAHSVARKDPHRSVHVSMAKNAAGEAATFSAKQAIQAHGAIGYTWEQDLHIWMRRAWSLDLAWGATSLHRARVAEAVLDRDARTASFGYEAPAA